MADNASSATSSEEGPPSCDRSKTEPSQLIHDRLERRSSKSRLLKQEVVEVAEETDMPSSGSGLAYQPQLGDLPDVTVEEGAVEEGAVEEGAATTTMELKQGAKVEVEEEDDHSPNSDTSDQTVVPAESLASSSATPHGSPKDNSPEESCSIDAHGTLDADKSSPTQAINPKVKLVRSQAVYEDASPPPEILIRSAAAASASSASPVRDVSSKGCASPVPYSGSSAMLSVSPTFQVRGLGRHKLGQDSSQGSTVSDTSPALSRDSSFETSYTDSTGTNLEEFIIRTLNKKQSDRTMLLHLESDMIAFIKDTSLEKHKFPQMSSYHRMLVHRVAAFFGLDHNVDESGKSVVINRLDCTRIPDFKFRDHIRDDLPQDDPPKKFILKRHRDCTSLEETRGTDRVAIDDRMSKSFEERQEEYHEARNRIFQQRELLQEIRAHPTVNRPNNLCSSHQSSKEDVRWHPDLRPWSSTDSSGYSTDSSSRLKVYVTKASSFHSVTVLTRGDSRTSTGSSTSRFSKTDSLSSGISNLGSPIVIPPTIPSSPPLEDQEFESCSSDMSTLSPSQQKSMSGEAQGSCSPFLSFTNETGEPLAIWVASTIDQIPPGSIIINPQTGEPYINADGSIYRWYPPSDWAGRDAESVTGAEESPDSSSCISEQTPAGRQQQDVDNNWAFHHQFTSLSVRSGESVPTLEVSPTSCPSHHPLPQMYLDTSVNPSPPSASISGPRVALHPVFPTPMPPTSHKAPPFYAVPIPGGQPTVRCISQLPVPVASGYQVVNSSEGHENQGQGHFGCMAPSYPSDVCQVMAFPQQMTIHSVETYPHPPEHGYAPQMVPCMYVPQYSLDRAKPSQIPNQQHILYVPATSTSPAVYPVEGACAPSVPNQGHVQIIRVNAATSPGTSGHVFYSGPPAAGPPGVQLPPPTGPVPHYVCYTYSPDTGHSGGTAMPVGHPYATMNMAQAPIVRPSGLNFPGVVSQARTSSSPKSPGQQQQQQQQQHHLPPSTGTSQLKMYVGNSSVRASQYVEARTEHGREAEGGFMPRQHLMPLRQPHVVFSSLTPASFLGDSRQSLPNVPPAFQNLVRPRTRVPDASLSESNDATMSSYQSGAVSIRESGSSSSSSSRSDAPKGQQRLT